VNKAIIIKQVQERYAVLGDVLNERSCRLWAAAEAKTIGRGGQALVATATGIHRNTIAAGMKEIMEARPLATNRIRKAGGGRKPATQKDPTLQKDIKAQVEASTRGDPESPLLYSSKSLRKITNAINTEKKRISHTSVGKELENMGYSLQANRKTHEGGDHIDRDAQFQFINAQIQDFQQRRQPVISVDTKKKELIGNFKNNGREYRPTGKPLEVNVYDFLIKEQGKVSPYGVYDLDKNKGWVSVGISADTAAFAVNSIRSWWQEMGKGTYPKATELSITADGGGSNSSRSRLWKVEVQKLATELDLTIHVSHFPPGTSKWNKIEHRMFCFISQNWRGKPLIDRATVVSLIGNTRTAAGLTIQARLDEREYPKGIKVSDAELDRIALKKNDFHGEWNYSISPVHA
jgi:hypothetical protein